MSAEDLAQAPQRKKKIWAFALIAIWIAVIWAAIAASLDPTLGPQPNGHPERSGEIIVFVIGYAFASAVLASVVTWLLFYVFFLRMRASLKKCLGVLAIMVVAAVAVAAPARFVAMGVRVNERTASIDAWSKTTSDRIRTLQHELDTGLSALGDLSVGRLQRQGDIDEILARNQRVVALYEDYSKRIETEIADAHTRADGLGLTAEEEAELINQFEARIYPRVRRDAQLNLQAARQRTAMVELLHGAKQKWTIRDGHLLFRDEALMQELTSMGAEYDRLLGEINANQPAADTP